MPETEEQDRTLEEQQVLNTKLLDACAALDLAEVERLTEDGAELGFQEDETGNGPLHAVVLATEPALASQTKSQKMLSFLLSNGAVWNQFNRAQETAGCTARRLGLDRLYAQLVLAGIQAEFLLTALDKTAGVHNAAERNAAFLEGHVVYTQPTAESVTLLDDEANAIMMTWERDIMERSAKLVAGPGKKVLNIGFGLGLIDDAIQRLNPARHVIIEAHPDVLAEMRRRGWYEKPNVEILEGRWQDIVDGLADRETFDGIYYDPFEYWEDMHAFFDAVVALLKPGGVFSFFHGLGADNQTFYDVYTAILEIELRDFGLSTEFVDMPIKTEEAEWKGAKRRYWALDTYKLPECHFIDV